MKLGLEISFDQFLVELQIDEIIYLLTLQCTLQKPTLFFKQKPNDIPTNVFSIHIGPLWEANINAQYILNSYAIASYCIFYLTKK
jgi:hypothetical protein